MKPAVEVSITSWKKNVVKPGQEYGRVLLMPGTGYNLSLIHISEPTRPY